MFTYTIFVNEEHSCCNLGLKVGMKDWIDIFLGLSLVSDHGHVVPLISDWMCRCGWQRSCSGLVTTRQSGWASPGSECVTGWQQRCVVLHQHLSPIEPHVQCSLPTIVISLWSETEREAKGLFCFSERIHRVGWLSVFWLYSFLQNEHVVDFIFAHSQNIGRLSGRPRYDSATGTVTLIYDRGEKCPETDKNATTRIIFKCEPGLSQVVTFATLAKKKRNVDSWCFIQALVKEICFVDRVRLCWRRSRKIASTSFLGQQMSSVQKESHRNRLIVNLLIPGPWTSTICHL